MTDSQEAHFARNSRVLPESGVFLALECDAAATIVNPSFL